MEAGVRDFGHVARQRQAVDLLVDGRPAGRQYVDIPAGGSAVVRFGMRFESGGDHAVEVRLVGDRRSRAMLTTRPMRWKSIIIDSSP